MAGFGDYAGFLSAFGYWIGSCIGNVSYWVLILRGVQQAAVIHGIVTVAEVIPILVFMPAAILFAPGTVLYRRARREQGKPVFDGTAERILFGVISLAAACGVHGLATGSITL